MSWPRRLVWLVLTATLCVAGIDVACASAATTTSITVYDASSQHQLVTLASDNAIATEHGLGMQGSGDTATALSAIHPDIVAADSAATEGADVGATTAHGAERVAGAGATRGGVLTPEQIVQVRGSGQLLTQADGASVRALQNSAGRYDVVVDGERGLITTFNNLSQKSFDRLANNYGWTP